MSDTNPSLSSLENAILQTIAYADIFDYPLTVEEIHRYLVTVPATCAQVDQALSEHPSMLSALSTQDGYYCFTGREAIIDTRRQRAKISQNLWAIAKSYGRRIGRLPFVRMVAVTGSLAANNADPNSDIDYLIVTEPKRLWLCRLFVIAMVKWAQFRGHTICPNYFISENALVIHERSLFTARELTQMVPVYGSETYHVLYRKNAWVAEFLPNAAFLQNLGNSHQESPDAIKRDSEALLRTRIGFWLERWEMNRKIRKLTGQNPESDEARFSPDFCKGHFDGHARRIMDAYRDRLNTIAYDGPTPIADLVEP
jgi:hypothetical protein